MKKYMTDEELLKLISDIEEKDIVKAPPGLAESVIEKVTKKKQLIEYKRYRNRVIAAVAAILVITVSASNYIEHVPNAIRNIDLRRSYYISDFFNESED